MSLLRHSYRPIQDLGAPPTVLSSYTTYYCKIRTIVSLPHTEGTIFNFHAESPHFLIS